MRVCSAPLSSRARRTRCDGVNGDEHLHVSSMCCRRDYMYADVSVTAANLSPIPHHKTDQFIFPSFARQVPQPRTSILEAIIPQTTLFFFHSLQTLTTDHGG